MIVNPSRYNPLIKLIQDNLSDDLLKVKYRKLHNRSKTEGHCYLAAQVAYYLLRLQNTGWTPIVIPKTYLGGDTHWFVLNREMDIIVDPTAEQFKSEVIPYDKGKPCGFMVLPDKRAKLLLKRMDY
jgi:hypothetical protein